MNINKLCLLLLTVVWLNLAKCAKILGIFPAPGYSQYIIGSNLLIPLAEKGHDVTMISIHETKGVKNYKNVLMVKPEEAVKSEDMFAMRTNNIFQNYDMLYYYGLDVAEKTLCDKNVQKLIHSQEKFDLVIVETILNEALFAFATHFKSKLILVNTMGMVEYCGYLVGNPVPPSYVPVVMGGYTSQMNFYERARNAVGFLYDAYKRKFSGHPSHQRLIDKYFPKEYALEEAIDKVDLLLINSHPSVTGVLPLTHAVKEIGGFHIKAKPLPENIKAFLDGAVNGAILFSMGSNLKSSDIPKPVLDRILKDFSKLEQKILWKFEVPNLENVPTNVLVSKWLPQTDIIAHPNVVAFISHGGLLSTTESMYYGVPMIAVPIFADQHMNVRRTVEFGAGLNLPFEKLGDGSLIEAVNKVLTDTSYKKNAIERSKLLRDRMVAPVDEAVYWVEYVLRLNNTRYLRSPVLDLSWYQVYLLDVAAVFLTALICGIIFLRLMCRAVCNMLKGKVKTKGNKKTD